MLFLISLPFAICIIRPGCLDLSNTCAVSNILPFCNFSYLSINYSFFIEFTDFFFFFQILYKKYVLSSFTVFLLFCSFLPWITSILLILNITSKKKKLKKKLAPATYPDSELRYKRLWMKKNDFFLITNTKK